MCHIRVYGCFSTNELDGVVFTTLWLGGPTSEDGVNSSIQKRQTGIGGSPHPEMSNQTWQSKMSYSYRYMKTYIYICIYIYIIHRFRFLDDFLLNKSTSWILPYIFPWFSDGLFPFKIIRGIVGVAHNHHGMLRPQVETAHLSVLQMLLGFMLYLLGIYGIN